MAGRLLSERGCAGQFPLGPRSPMSQTLLQGSLLPSAPPQPCPACSCQASSSQASCQFPPCRAGGLLPRTPAPVAVQMGPGQGPWAGGGHGRLLCVVSGTGGAVGIERAGLRMLDVPLPGCQLGPTGNPGDGGETVTHMPLLHVLV